jgi:hypothetical protein
MLNLDADSDSKSSKLGFFMSKSKHTTSKAKSKMVPFFSHVLHEDMREIQGTPCRDPCLL